MSDPVVLLSTGDVVGPAGGVTDNSMVLFSGTSGKLIKGNNAVVTAAGLALLDDVNAAAQKVTLGLGNVDNTSDINKPISTATQTALNLKATIASPTFTGTPTAPTATAGTNTTQLATTDFVTTADNLKANINSPTFTGVPTAPTATAGANTTQLANTEFVKTAIDNVNILKSIGIDQTWQSVIGSRAINTSYTNSTGRPIVVSVTVVARAGNEDFAIVVDGVTVASITNLGTSGEYIPLNAIVPVGSIYSVNAFATVTVNKWAELR